MALREDVETAIERALEQHPEVQRAVSEGPDDGHGRGEAADALQDMLTARNALLDAASRWDDAAQ